MRTSRRRNGSRGNCDSLTDSVDEWVLVDFRTPVHLSELVADALWELGVVAVEELDSSPGWVTLRTSLGDVTGPSVAAIVSRFDEVTATAVSFPSSVADTWRDFVSPSHVVDDVWIVPQWCEPPAGRCVMVEPFDTFGLGNHPTTVLTLRGVLRWAGRQDSVLDLGSGSGVLSVALASLVGCRVDAHDIAAQGERALLHNADLNRVRHLVGWLPTMEGTVQSPYDIVMANILAPVLRELAPVIESVARPGAIVVLSGLRENQVDAVVDCFGNCLNQSVEILDGWAGVTLRRK